MSVLWALVWGCGGHGPMDFTERHDTIALPRVLPAQVGGGESRSWVKLAHFGYVPRITGEPRQVSTVEGLRITCSVFLGKLTMGVGPDRQAPWPAVLPEQLSCRLGPYTLITHVDVVEPLYRHADELVARPERPTEIRHLGASGIRQFFALPEEIPAWSGSSTVLQATSPTTHRGTCRVRDTTEGPRLDVTVRPGIRSFFLRADRKRIPDGDWVCKVRVLDGPWALQLPLRTVNVSGAVGVNDISAR
ncbi:MAG: hypothetical protein KTR31_18340 [Myxococcales bacterium]|nr:hypothetical protein [Myxococcales bacterium]